MTGLWRHWNCAHTHTHKHSHTRPWTQSLIRTLRTLTWLKSLIKYTRIHILGYISNSRNSQTLKLDICSYTELINRAPLLLLWLVSVQPHIAPVSPVSGSAEVRGRRSEEQEQEAAEEWQSKGGVWHQRKARTSTGDRIIYEPGRCDASVWPMGRGLKSV